VSSGVDAFLVPYGDRLHLFASQAPDPSSRRPAVAEALRCALAHLGSRDQQLLAVYFFERWPQRQIGAALRISQQAVSMRLGRSLGRLRRLLLVAAALGPRCPECGRPRPFADRPGRQGRCRACAQAARWQGYAAQSGAERARAYRERQKRLEARP
jgi:hypothetical protein